MRIFVRTNIWIYKHLIFALADNLCRSATFLDEIRLTQC